MRMPGPGLGEEVDFPESVEDAEQKEYDGEDESNGFHRYEITPMRASMKQTAPTTTQYQPNGRRSFERK